MAPSRATPRVRTRTREDRLGRNCLGGMQVIDIDGVSGSARFNARSARRR